MKTGEFGSAATSRSEKLPCRTRTGATVVELLVAIGTTSMLAGLLLPAVQSAREAVRATHCRNNLHQIGVAAYHFYDQQGFLETQQALRSLLPHIGEADLGRRLEALEVRDASPSAYVCPADSLAERSQMDVNYAINGGSNISQSNGVIRHENNGLLRFSEVTNGLSQTACMAEKLIWLCIAEWDQLLAAK